MQDGEKCPKFSIRKLIKSFSFAGRGVAWVWRSEPNFRVHCLTAFIAAGLGFFLKIGSVEWIAIVISIGMVMGAEVFNSSIEVLADAVHPQKHPLIEKAKDASAGAVLLFALAALIVGAIIFLPKLWLWIQMLLEMNG